MDISKGVPLGVGMGLAVRLNKDNGVGWGGVRVARGPDTLVAVSASVNVGMLIAGGFGVS